MKRTYVRLIILTLLCLGAALMAAGCGLSSLRPTEIPDTMTAGSTYALGCTYMGNAIEPDALYYASEDTSVATVGEDGVIHALKEGETTIFVQHKEKSAKTEFSLKVVYDVKDETDEHLSVKEYAVHADDSSSYPFYGRNEYSERVDDWDIIEIVKIVASKSEDDYLFTDVYCSATAYDGIYVTISDWGNGDVTLNPAMLEVLDLSTYLSECIGLNTDILAQAGKDIATRKIIGDIFEQMQNLGYGISLSELSDEYEYRVTVRVDYNVYRTVNFYSRGMIKGGWNVLVDLFKMDISSFLNSYTYNKELYEIVLSDCDLIIEKRPK